MALIDTLSNSLFSTVRCPYCNEKFHLGDCAIISQTHKGTVIRHAPKGSLNRFWSRLTAQPLVGEENTGEWTSRECPNCQKLLPYNFDLVEDNITIAVVGDLFSGKSHYIAAAIEGMRRGKLSSSYGACLFKAVGFEVEQRYQIDYYQPLFEQHKRLLGTPPASPADPLIYTLTSGGKYGKKVNLLIYDASGEDIADQLQFVRYKRNILNAKAIIFLADPWTMPGFTGRLAHHLRPEQKEISSRLASDVLEGVVETFKRNGGELGSMFSLPVAIALSKSDLIQYLMGLDNNKYRILYDVTYAGNADENEEEVDKGVRDLLEELNERSLLRLSEGFERVNFFAVSSTGSSVDVKTQKYPKVEPLRCLDPLLWVLKELRVLE